MAKVGERFEPAYGYEWWDGNANDGPPRGYFPLKADGTTDFKTRLRWIDDAPGDPNDSSGHFEVMASGAGYGYYHGVGGDSGGGGGTLGVSAPRIVPLEATVEGKASVDGKEDGWTRIKYLLNGGKP